MPQQCPHCITEVHPDASTCPACGAARGVWGRPLESWRRASTFMLSLAAFFILTGVGFGMLVSSDYATTWFDGVIAFLFLSPFMLFSGSIGLFMRYVIPRMPESWYR